MNRDGRAKKQVRYEDEQSLGKRSRSLQRGSFYSPAKPGKKMDKSNLATKGFSRSKDSRPSNWNPNQNQNQPSKAFKEQSFNSLVSGPTPSVKKLEESKKANVEKYIQASKELTGKNSKVSKKNSTIARRSLSVAEAAAKLSFPWRVHPIVDGQNSPDRLPSISSSVSISRISSTFIQDMKNFLESHEAKQSKSQPNQNQNRWPQAQIKNPQQNTPTNNLNSQLGPDLDTSFGEIMESVKLAYLQTKLSKQRQYKPLVVPHWDEVETNWPGFERKPLENWLNYAIPSRLQPEIHTIKKGKRPKNEPV